MRGCNGRVAVTDPGTVSAADTGTVTVPATDPGRPPSEAPV